MKSWKPSFFKLKRPARSAGAQAAVPNIDAARSHLESAGAALIAYEDHDGSRRWMVEYRGYHHAGVPDDGLIHIANEDARLH